MNDNTSFISILRTLILDGLKELFWPVLKDVIREIMDKLLDNLFGDNIRTSSGYTNYSRSLKKRNRNNKYSTNRRRSIRRFNTSPEMPDIYFESRSEVQNAYNHLQSQLRRLKFLTMMQVFEVIGEPSSTIHGEWGWYDLDDLDIVMEGNGYLLVFPPPASRD